MLQFNVAAADYLEGQCDGQRYFVDGHHELMDKYENRTAAYQMGFDSAKNHPRAADPDFAS